jgi:hypothetical protein
MAPIVRAKYLRLTEETNALDYLLRAGQFIKEAENDLSAWKWVVLALHGSLYGFAICACKGTNPDNVMFRTKKGYDNLISFDRALQLCQDPKRMKMLLHSQPLILTESQKNSIQLLKKELRNNFEHYSPKGWSIEVHGMPQIAIDVLAVIRFLATETYTYVNLKRAHISKLKSIVYQCTKYLKNSSLHKEALLASK